MEPTKFDDFTKALATAASRRQALKAIGVALGGALGLSRIGTVFADQCKPPGTKCFKNQQCCSKVCCNGKCCDSGQSCQSGMCACVPNGGSCTSDNQCCLGLCCDGTCCSIGTSGICCPPGYPVNCCHRSLVCDINVGCAYLSL
jgi:hypothetical protein